MGYYLNFEYEYRPIEHERVEEPKISVIVPVYNVEPYLRQCLKSIEEQTFEEFEVICVDDGSTDGSLEILSIYSKVDKRFIVVAQDNQGQGVARNNALKLAKGDYIIFVDPDDWVETNSFEVLYNFASKVNAEIVQFNFKDFNETTKAVKVRNFADKMKRKYNISLKDCDFYYWRQVKNAVLNDLPMCVWTYFYSREFLNKNNLQFAETRIAEDHIFSLGAIFSAEKIYYKSDCFYNYRCRKGSAVEIISIDNFCIFEIIEKVKSMLLKKGILDEVRKSFEKYAIELMAIRFDNVPKESVADYIDRCRQSLSKWQYLIFQLRTRAIYSFAEWIFSVKNRRKNGTKYKQIVILGLLFKLE